MKKRSRVHVFMVEEDQFFASIYKQYFEEAGWKVSLHANGEDVYQEVKKKRPTVILLDLLLTQADGYAILQELTADKQLSVIPVFILTHMGQKADIDKAFALGATDYLIKTQFKPAETMEKILHHLTATRPPAVTE